MDTNDRVIGYLNSVAMKKHKSSMVCNIAAKIPRDHKNTVPPFHPGRSENIIFELDFRLTAGHLNFVHELVQYLHK